MVSAHWMWDLNHTCGRSGITGSNPSEDKTTWGTLGKRGLVTLAYTSCQALICPMSWVPDQGESELSMQTFHVNIVMTGSSRDGCSMSVRVSISGAPAGLESVSAVHQQHDPWQVTGLGFLPRQMEIMEPTSHQVTLKIK